LILNKNLALLFVSYFLLASSEQSQSRRDVNPWQARRAESSADIDQLLLATTKTLAKLDLPIKSIEHKRNEDGKLFLIVKLKTLDGINQSLDLREARKFLSKGTFNTLNIVIIINIASAFQSCLLIDEYDAALHHKLSIGILDLIRNRSETNSSQTITATHDIQLLDHNFRRDSIFILSKNENLSTVISKASDYSVRKDAKLSLKYLNNEFGSLPNILSMNDE
jgi:AAA15 family ATPase/GTPase